MDKINPLLSLTGGLKGLQSVTPAPREYTGGGAVEAVSNPPKRAVDKIPPLQMTNYTESLRAQAGYGPGESHRMIWA